MSIDRPDERYRNLGTTGYVADSMPGTLAHHVDIHRDGMDTPISGDLTAYHQRQKEARP